MNMNRIQRLFTALVVILGLFAFSKAAVAAGKANHHDGKQLVGANLKTDGRHVIHKKGDYTASVDVKGGKIAGLHVHHPTKGDVPVKKYKTHRKMAQVRGLQHGYYLLVQDQDLGTVYIGFAYVNDDGDEEIYWFPYDMILDGDTGAVEYVPES
jgi:hypothetical protein